MDINKTVYCRVMKGLGPEWTDKTVFVYLDDIESGLSDSYINDIIRNDVKEQLKNAGYIQYNIIEIT